MNILERMLNMSRKKSTKRDKDADDGEEANVAQRSYSGGSWTWDWAKGNAYDNIYPSISRIANAFVNIRPYAIDSNGKPVQDVNALNRIYHPNKMMSAADFREALAVLTLVHRKAYLLVWHIEDGRAVAGAGQNLTEETIAGFTFLEDAAIIVRDGRKSYKSATYRHEFTEADVIEITAGVDPYDITAGYSPTQAVKKWANIDDFAADYEAGLLENNAVPAGQFTITAATVEQFDDIVDEMQRRHRGAGNNNNVNYVHRPIDSLTGSPLSAQIEWTPFAQSNQSLDLATIFKQANDKIDSTFGVPSSIRGVNDKNTYASVKVDERIFVEYTVKPLATRIWTRFTHELNRITGGLGYAITFDVEIPNVAEEEKLIAEKKRVELDIITTALERGYSLDSVVNAFELSNSYKLLEMGEDEGATIENDKPEVDDGEEVEESPDEAVTKHVCDHSLDVASKSADAETLKDLRQTLTEFVNAETNNIIESLKGANSKMLTAEEFMLYDKNGDGIIDEDEALLIPIDEVPGSHRYELTMAILAILLLRMAKSGDKRYKEVALMFGIELPDGFKDYTVSGSASKAYQDIISKISNSISEQVADVVRSAIQKAAASKDKVTMKELEKAIRKEVEENKWRIERIVNTEEHRADNLGQIDAIKQLEQLTGRDFGLKWKTTSGNPCKFCKSMNQTVVATGEAFVPLGGKIELEGGGSYINTYGDMLTPNAHPNCQCVFEVVEL